MNSNKNHKKTHTVFLLPLITIICLFMLYIFGTPFSGYVIEITIVKQLPPANELMNGPRGGYLNDDHAKNYLPTRGAVVEGIVEMGNPRSHTFGPFHQKDKSHLKTPIKVKHSPPPELLTKLLRHAPYSDSSINLIADQQILTHIMQLKNDRKINIYDVWSNMFGIRKVKFPMKKKSKHISDIEDTIVKGNPDTNLITHSEYPKEAQNR